jgi:hypothetical protein
MWHVCGKEEMHTRFWKESLREKEHLEDIRVDGMISLRIGRDGLDWTDVTEERDRWRAVVDNVMNFGFQEMRGISGIADELLSSNEELCFMHLLVS